MRIQLWIALGFLAVAAARVYEYVEVHQRHVYVRCPAGMPREQCGAWRREREGE